MNSTETWYRLLILFAVFILPWMTVLFCYCSILRDVARSKKSLLKMGARQFNNLLVEYTFIFFFLGTTVSLLPHVAWIVVRLFKIPLDHGNCKRLKIFSEQFILLMPVLNPILYSLLGKKFRLEFTEYLKRKSGSRSSYLLSRLSQFSSSRRKSKVHLSPFIQSPNATKITSCKSPGTPVSLHDNVFDSPK
ncbi:unnamed protein product [Oikopleura dioica]|uniref:G-protein coupled receptors family 1 profile domain-containing protein n=1 Tax=Oikopleura dioica TaxID=34765 RepID=E4X3L2_OIKDI|nr:unnamed protein product [Oikopleura dioica]